MSGEFGDESYGGFFHNKIFAALDDLLDANYKSSLAWVPLFEVLAPLAKMISYDEACDSTPVPAKHLEILRQIKEALIQVQDNLREA